MVSRGERRNQEQRIVARWTQIRCRDREIENTGRFYDVTKIDKGDSVACRQHIAEIGVTVNHLRGQTRYDWNHPVRIVIDSTCDSRTGPVLVDVLEQPAQFADALQVPHQGLVLTRVRVALQCHTEPCQRGAKLPRRRLVEVPRLKGLTLHPGHRTQAIPDFSRGDCAAAFTLNCWNDRRCNDVIRFLQMAKDAYLKGRRFVFLSRTHNLDDIPAPVVGLQTKILVPLAHQRLIAAPQSKLPGDSLGDGCHFECRWVDGEHCEGWGQGAHRHIVTNGSKSVNQRNLWPFLGSVDWVPFC